MQEQVHGLLKQNVDLTSSAETAALHATSLADVRGTRALCADATLSDRAGRRDVSASNLRPGSDLQLGRWACGA